MRAVWAGLFARAIVAYKAAQVVAPADARSADAATHDHAAQDHPRLQGGLSAFPTCRV